MHESDLLVTLNTDSPVFVSVVNAFREYYAKSLEIWMQNIDLQHADGKDYSYRFPPTVRSEHNRNSDTAYWDTLQHKVARYDHGNGWKNLVNREPHAEAPPFGAATVEQMRDKQRACLF